MDERPVLILTGAPGTGKTTTASILAGRSPAAVHLETDAFFRFIRSGYIEPWKPESQAQNQVAMGIAGEAAAAYAAAGYFTVVEGIVLPRWFLAPLRGTLRKAGFRAVYAVLRAPLPLCLERVERRDGAVDQAAVTKIWTEFEDLGELEPNVLAVGDRNSEEIANTVEQTLASGSHLV
ncbi:MAG TPA: AAA family ATPase [Solirubrobacterales bacterium]|nr:AAA family ATPase [Solirubrobacterales bacterium]